MQRLTVIACAALLSACAGSPETAQVEPAATTVASASTTASSTESTRTASDDGVGLECKRVKETGTRFTTKVCTTRAQREAAAAAAANSANTWTIRNSSAGGPLEGG